MMTLGDKGCVLLGANGDEPPDGFDTVQEVGVSGGRGGGGYRCVCGYVCVYKTKFPYQEVGGVISFSSEPWYRRCSP